MSISLPSTLCKGYLTVWPKAKVRLAQNYPQSPKNEFEVRELGGALEVSFKGVLFVASKSK
jgi:hypothetical protein